MMFMEKEQITFLCVIPALALAAVLFTLIKSLFERDRAAASSVRFDVGLVIFLLMIGFILGGIALPDMPKAFGIRHTYFAEIDIANNRRFLVAVLAEIVAVVLSVLVAALCRRRWGRPLFVALALAALGNFGALLWMWWTSVGRTRVKGDSTKQ